MRHGIFRLWGMPIGEFFDLEALSQFCAESKRYSFFFSSWPLNVYVTPPANHAACSYVMRPFILKLGRGCESSERIGECDLSVGWRIVFTRIVEGDILMEHPTTGVRL